MADGALIGLMNDGGWVMWVLLGFSVVATAVTAERVWVLAKARIDLGTFLGRLGEAVGCRAWRAASAVCSETGGPVTSVAEAGLSRTNRSLDEVEKAMVGCARAQLRRLERGFVLLATVANLAPLFGFFGTVTGMIRSFGAISRYGISDPTKVAGGIEEALLTTAAGLAVAIPAQLAYNLLQGRLGRIAGDMEVVGDHLLDWLSGSAQRSERGEPV